MKKKLLGIIVAAMGLILVACASQDKEVESVEITDAASQETEASKETPSENESYEKMSITLCGIGADERACLGGRKCRDYKCGNRHLRRHVCMGVV